MGCPYYCLCTTIDSEYEHGRFNTNIMLNDFYGEDHTLNTPIPLFGNFSIRVLPAASDITESTSAVATPKTITNTSVPVVTTTTTTMPNTKPIATSTNTSLDRTTTTTTTTTPNKPIFFNGPVVNYAGEPYFKAGQTAAFRGFDREGGTLNIRKFDHGWSDQFPLCDQTDPGSAILVSEKFSAVPGSPDGAFELQLTIPTTWSTGFHVTQICYVDSSGNIFFGSFSQTFNLID